MGISNHLKELRAKVGHDLLLLPSATAIVFDDSGRMLLVRDADVDEWVAPGGSIEPNEAPADAVVREVWEETGLWVAPVGLIGVYGGSEFLVRYSNGDRVQYVMSVFECEVVEGQARPDGSETYGF